MRSATRKRPWVIHLVLMLSYVTMLILIMFFLKRMWAGPAIDWRVHVFGYLASAGLLGATIWALRGRIKKVEEHYKHSHESDWMFLVLLIVVAATGVLQHVLHRAGADVAANVSYVIHLMAVVPMLGLEVPVQQVVAHGLPSAGHVLLRATRKVCRLPRPKRCRPAPRPNPWPSLEPVSDRSLRKEERMSTDKKTIVVFSGDYDKAIAAFIIANGAAAMGDEVTMFFTFWGLDIIRKNKKVKTSGKSFLQSMFCKMMPRGTASWVSPR